MGVGKKFQEGTNNIFGFQGRGQNPNFIGFNCQNREMDGQTDVRTRPNSIVPTLFKCSGLIEDLLLSFYLSEYKAGQRFNISWSANE